MMVRDATAGAIIFTHHPAMRDYVRNLVKRIHPPAVAATIDVHVAPSPIDEMRITAGSHRTRHVLRDHALLEERAVNAPLIPRTVPDEPTVPPATARFSLDTLREWRMPSVSETSHGH